MTLTLEQAKNTAEIVGVLIAVMTLLKGVYEYTKQAAQRRAEHFIEMRDRYDQFLDVCTLLEKETSSEQAKEQLENLAFEKKRDFLGFYEEIALMMNSGLIRADVAHYMFGYYAIRCWHSAAFWNAPIGNLKRDSFYWGVFRDFAEQIEKMEGDGLFQRSFKRYRI